MNLVFSGSGVRYPIHIGAYTFIRGEAGIIPSAIAAQSGGSIVAAAIAHGRSPEGIWRAFREYNVAKLIDWRPSSIGLIKGGKLLASFKREFPLKMGDLKIPLYIGAVDASTRRAVFFSSEHTPDVYTYDAVRASMSIPIVFHLHKIDGKYYMDGGVGNNLPLSIFSDSNDTLGVRITSGSESEGYDFNTSNPFKKMKNTLLSTVESLMDATDNASNAGYKIISVKTNYRTVDFSVTTSDYDKMVYQGYSQTEKQWTNMR